MSDANICKSHNIMSATFTFKKSFYAYALNCEKLWQNVRQQECMFKYDDFSHNIKSTVTFGEIKLCPREQL